MGRVYTPTPCGPCFYTEKANCDKEICRKLHWRLQAVYFLINLNRNGAWGFQGRFLWISLLKWILRPPGQFPLHVLIESIRKPSEMEPDAFRADSRIFPYKINRNGIWGLQGSLSISLLRSTEMKETWVETTTSGSCHTHHKMRSAQMLQAPVYLREALQEAPGAFFHCFLNKDFMKKSKGNCPRAVSSTCLYEIPIETLAKWLWSLLGSFPHMSL